MWTWQSRHICHHVKMRGNILRFYFISFFFFLIYREINIFARVGFCFSCSSNKQLEIGKMKIILNWRFLGCVKSYFSRMEASLKVKITFDIISRAWIALKNCFSRWDRRWIESENYSQNHSRHLFSTARYYFVEISWLFSFVSTVIFLYVESENYF